MPYDSFHSTKEENPDLNQYWYSEQTCEVLCNAVRESLSLKGRSTLKGGSTRAAFLSTPSLFFHLTDEERKQCMLFDFDKTLSSCTQCAFYDFNHPENIDAELHGQFDVIIIDPPFISQSVWESYASTAALLSAKDAHIICTTVEQNEELMHRLFKCSVTTFQPSIPTLVYQYNCYTNFPSVTLATTNTELE